MLWGYPYSFFLLLGALPAIFILHSLRPRGTKFRTSTLFLLERVLRERPMGKRIGWLLRRNLLILLQILAAIILIAALADPSLLGYGQPAGNVVVVVDLTASMKARGPAGSRFESSRREFLSLIAAKPEDQRMMVIGAGPTPQVLLPFTSDRGKLKRLARGLQPTDAPGQVREAILFAHAFLREESNDKVVVLSDGAFEGFETLPWHSPHLRLVRAEGGSENIGITAFEFRRVPADPTEVEIMLSIRNFTDRSVRAPLTVSVGERTLVQEDVQIGARGRRVLIYSYRGPVKGRARALLEVEDDFPTDNEAFLVLSPSPVIRVLYAGKGNLFLEQLFRSFPRVELTRVDGPGLVQQHQPYDVIVYDGVSPPSKIEGNVILINTVGAGLPLKAAGKVVRPRPIPIVEKHPLARGLHLDDVYIEEASRLELLSGGIVLARSKETPLIVALETEKLKALVFGFDLLDSDLPYRVSFPLLFSHVLAWFRLSEAEFPTVQVPSGAVYGLHLKSIDGRVEVRSPSGVKETFRPISRTIRFAGTTEVGFYTFWAGGRKGEFAVNLFSESESQIRSPSSGSRLEAAEEGRGGGGGRKKGLSLWPFLLLLVLLLLGLEAFLACRGAESFLPVLARLPALLAVVVALGNPRVFKVTEALDVILGLDYSRSVGQEGKDKALDILEKARRLKGPETRIGLLSFGNRPAWEFLPRVDYPLSDFSPSVGRGETNIAAALQASLAQLGEGHEGRILLVSDGNENRGETSRVIPLLRSHAVQVWVLPVGFSQGENEIYLRDFVVPQRVDSAETFEIRGAVESLREAEARIKLLRDGIVRKEVEMHLRAGTNWLSLNDTLGKQGSHTYELLVESAEDTLAENNLLQAVVEVRGPPRVLYLRSPEAPRRAMAQALAVQGYDVVEMDANETGLTLPGLAAYDLLVLDNLPAYRLSQAMMEAVEKYVRDLGGGLIVLGGPKSYGAGGYYRTPLERVLPLEMRPPARLELPHVALLFVLDKSGSMGTGPQGMTKLDLAKAAALASAELLNPSDQVGILAFDAQWEWVIPFRRVGKGEWISERIASLESDGGTDLRKALVEAHRAFSSNRAAVKHVLVLSDGLTDKADFHSLIEEMGNDGITVSTVSVGRDADLALMRDIARDGRGRGYVTVDPRTIPQIFTTETLLISRNLLVEKVVQPKLLRTDGPLKGFSQEQIPALRGYVLTHPKPLAEVLMQADDDPLLVSWRYGLGRVLAFTSDLTGRWGKDWVTWEAFPRWAGQLARSAMKSVSGGRIRSEFKGEADGVRAVVDYLSTQGRPMNHLRLRGIFTGPDRFSTEGPFRQVAPGRYESRFSARRRGIYLMTVYDEGRKGNGSPVVVTVPYISPYPREYREVRPNMALLSRLTEQTGGQMLQPDRLEQGLKRLLTPDPRKGAKARETWWALSILSLLLFLADLAVRRFWGKVRG